MTSQLHSINQNVGHFVSCSPPYLVHPLFVFMRIRHTFTQSIPSKNNPEDPSNTAIAHILIFLRRHGLGPLRPSRQPLPPLRRGERRHRRAAGDGQGAGGAGSAGGGGAGPGHCHTVGDAMDTVCHDGTGDERHDGTGSRDPNAWGLSAAFNAIKRRQDHHYSNSYCIHIHIYIYVYIYIYV